MHKINRAERYIKEVNKFKKILMEHDHTKWENHIKEVEKCF